MSLLWYLAIVGVAGVAVVGVVVTDGGLYLRVGVETMRLAWRRTCRRRQTPRTSSRPRGIMVPPPP